MRLGIPARFAHATVVRCWEVGRPLGCSAVERAAREGGSVPCEHCTVDACEAEICAVVMSSDAILFWVDSIMG